VEWFGEKTPNIAVKVNYSNTTQVCSPNQVSGCKVCKADGSAWQDDNSKCTSGQTCKDGVCIASCANECSTSGAKQYSSATGYQTCGNYDNDSCLEWSTPVNCPTGTCVWDGDGNNFTRECVPNGQTRENSWARTVCRNGTWKASLNGWGCTNGFNCDSGTCQIIGGIGFCRDSNMVDPGYTKSCANGETCPSGTSCNNTMCCPPGTCGWGGWPTFNNVCIANGGYAENVWARLFVVMAHGKYRFMAGDVLVISMRPRQLS